MKTNPVSTFTWIPLTVQDEDEDLVPVISAEKEFFYDEDGNEWIDGISSWWTVIHGHRHPKITQAIETQLKSLDHIILAGHVHRPAEMLSKKLLELADNDFEKVFYSDNGSNAVEIALKLAIQYYKNQIIETTEETQNSSNGVPSRESFLIFSSSYHGDSIGSMNVSGLTYFNRIFANLRFPTFETPAPNCFQCRFGKTPDICKTECLDSLEKEILKKKYAGVVIEPLVFGAAGMIFYDRKVLEKIRTLCEKTNTLLILDEVFTGMGRLGKNFAYQLAGVKPDLLAIAKGLTGGSLPLAATLVSKKIYSRFQTKDPFRSFFHAHTMTGNAVSCAAGIASVDLLLSEKDLVPSLQTKLQILMEELQKRLGGKLKNPRVLGAIAAFDWPEEIAEDEYLNPVGKEIRNQLKKNFVLLRPLGRTIYITPPYTISPVSLEKIFHALYDVLSNLGRRSE
ncbi:MAG: adenosylmethionine--8-amino-7-oxononanoate transaminase [Leptospira sp.]|nr:adenosylmethionine--8-amino-7-oxononanoate transaminase [Leptospira sp.]